MQSRGANDGVPVDTPTRWRDGSTVETHNGRAVPRDSIRDGSSLSVEVHEEVVRARGGGTHLGRGVVADLHGDIGRSADDDVEVNSIERTVGGRVSVCLPASITGGSTIAAGAGRVRTMGVDDFFLGDGKGGGVPIFIGVDVVWENLTPAIVGHVGDIGLGLGGDRTAVERADVVGFAKVVPGEDL